MSYSYAYVSLIKRSKWMDLNLRLVLIIILFISNPLVVSIVGNASAARDHDDRHHRDHDHNNFANDPNLDPEADVEEGD